MLAAASVLVACLTLNCLTTCADEPVERVEPLAAEVDLLDSAGGLLAADHALRFLGPRSCAATACHGGVDTDPRFPLSRRNEYVAWLDHDPHARGRVTLANEKSRAILERLTRPADDATTQARRLANCFGCHNPQPPAAQQADTFYPRDGVSCEICHGAAERWIGDHVDANWRAGKESDRENWRVRARGLGFLDTEDLVVRGQTCAQCHVGSPGREVNHDLIAAGHSVLKFELAAYHELLPKHWRDDLQRRNNPRFEVELWSAGQVTAADAALGLLAWRADSTADKHPDATWPELAEYDCFACHHDLEDPSWRRQRVVAGLPLGQPAWGTWYFGPLRQMNALIGGGDDGLNLVLLTKQMQTGFGRDKRQIQETVLPARGELVQRGEMESLARFGQRMRRALDELASERGRPESDLPARPASWDEAVQLYLAIVAMDQAKPTIAATTFAATRELFAFPPSYDSPRGFFGERMPGTLPGDDPPASAGQRSRTEIIAALIDLIQQLEPLGN